MSYGEIINVDAPTVTVTGSVSGSFTVTGTNVPFNIHTGVDNTSVTKVDTGRTLKYDEKIPTIVGEATITITAVNGTQAHYTLSGKAPKSNGKRANANPDISDRDVSATRIYEAPIKLKQNRPGAYSPTVLKVRSYKLVGGKVSPNEKSKLLHIRFLITKA